MKRRGFLRGALLLLAVGAAFATGVYRLLRERRSGAATGSVANVKASVAPSDVPARLRAHLGTLASDDGLLARFAADLAGDPRHDAPEETDAQLAARFLLSTDFFQNDGDESRRLTYVAYYEPYASPCYNPLARFD